jgi:hypothetical protein
MVTTRIITVAVAFTFILVLLNVYALSQLDGKVSSILDMLYECPAIFAETSAQWGIQQPSTVLSVEMGQVMADAC